MLLWPSDCIKSIPTQNNNNNNNNTHPKATVVKMEGQRNLAPHSITLTSYLYSHLINDYGSCRYAILGVESFYGPEDFEVMTNKLH